MYKETIRMYIISSTQLLFDKVPNQKYINILKELC